MSNDNDQSPFRIPPEWIWRGVILLWFMLNTWMLSKFVTQEAFVKEVTILTGGMAATGEKLQNRLESMADKITKVEMSTQIEANRFTLVEDHERRLRVLEQSKGGGK